LDGGRLVGVLGGDDRERELIAALCGAGHAVLAAGRDLSAAEKGAGARSAALEAVLAAPVVIGPLPGIRPDGQVVSRAPHPGVTLTPDLLAAVPQGALWMCGALRGPVSGWLRERGATHLDLAEHDELTVLNSIPSAEGAIMLAMQHSPLCLHGAEALVIGYGRCAVTVAMMLRGIGSSVTVVARSPGARARAVAAAHRAARLTALRDLLPAAEFCFNTVPSPVITADLLEVAHPDLTLIDLASAPGGVDYQAAADLGARAILAPGLPGLVAPKTAGRYLAQTILSLLKERVTS
jgi:dipicolinate synthase subunit A